jgi:hypothetical protein
MHYLPTDPSNTPPAPKAPSWRDRLAIHPAAELFPLMGEAELRELANDIEKNGLQEQPVLYRDPELGLCVLDGRNRLDACELIGRETVYAGGTPAVGSIRGGSRSFDPVAFVLSKNLHRRHLTADQRRELIAKVLKAKPEASNRQIASETKASHVTVGAVRRELESTGQIDQLKKTVGADGKARPVKAKKKSISIAVPPAPIKAAINADPEAKPALVVTIPTQVGTTLASAIQSDWRIAVHAFEVLTSHTPAQVATAIAPANVPLITEIANYFAKLVELTTRSTGNGEAPAAGADHQQRFRSWLLRQEAPAVAQPQAEINPLIPADLSVPDFLRRQPQAAS